MTEEVFFQKMEKFKDEDYEIIKRGETTNDTTVIKCLKCGNIISHKNSYLFSKRKLYLCKQCHYKRKDTIQNEEKIRRKFLSMGIDKYEFYMQNTYNNIRHHWVRFTCNKCGKINNKEVSNLLRQQNCCSYCDGSKFKKDSDVFKIELKEKYGEKFSLLSEYECAMKNIRVRCNRCGFIRNIKPNTLLSSGYCPKCDSKESRGEKTINKFLTERNVYFESQKYFSEWNIGLHYFDFYIPEYNLIIEYHGKHHYEFNDFFHKDEEDFIYRKEKDKIKKEKAIKNGFNYVSIKYSMFPKILSILNKLFDSTTIPQGSRGKCLEIETIQDLDEDIVYSLSKDKVEE